MVCVEAGDSRQDLEQRMTLSNLKRNREKYRKQTKKPKKKKRGRKGGGGKESKLPPPQAKLGVEGFERGGVCILREKKI